MPDKLGQVHRVYCPGWFGLGRMLPVELYFAGLLRRAADFDLFGRDRAGQRGQ